MTNQLICLLTERLGPMLEAIEALVVQESPSRHKPALDGLASHLAGRFEALGLHVERLPNPSGGDHLRIDVPGRDAAAPGVLILGHFDTVWPLGTLANMPFRIEDDRAWGPGAYDMKADLVLVEFALRALLDLERAPARPITILLTSDEEIGSPTSREWIEALAQPCAYTLVVEPPLPDGRLKTARKGVGAFTMDVVGRSAHAGVEPEKGVSAVVELAHQVLALARLADPAAGTTLNVGVVQGGTTGNVVPASATATIDARVATLDEARRLERDLAGLRPVLPGASVTIRGGFNRPPMERTQAAAALFERARAIGQTLGLDLGEGSTGGGSDGNFTAALGVATLDGLGALGAGAHAINEHVIIEHLPRRAALLAALLLEL